MASTIRNFLGLMTLGGILAGAGCDRLGWGVSSDRLDANAPDKPVAPESEILVSAHADNAPVEELSANSSNLKELSAPPPNPFPATHRQPGRNAVADHANKPPILHVTMQTGRVDGLPIGLFSDKTLLMRANGRIDYLPTDQILSHRVSDQPFVSQDFRGMKLDLHGEFGNSYAIQYANPFLVVAKPSRINTWCTRFQKFHQSIRSYCTTYGIPLRNLEFSLVAIVFGSRTEFNDYAKSEGSTIPSNCVGYYSQRSNRIVMFENDDPNELDSTLETICHEATHQFSFNSGLHQRLAETPNWLMEGFAVQFEAPAYCNFSTRGHASFWPSSQRQAWEELKNDPMRLKQIFHDLIATDEPFKSDTLNAYTVSWAMNAYLSQRRGVQYVAYLKRIGNLKPFSKYSRGDRMRDFSAAFGSDFSLLIRETTLHIDQLR